MITTSLSLKMLHINLTKLILHVFIFHSRFQAYCANKRWNRDASMQSYELFDSVCPIT